MKEFDPDKLGKIVALAKQGVGGEKTVAVHLVKRLCKKHGLDFEEVMSQTERLKEYTIAYRTRKEKELLIQVICRYALTSIDAEVSGNDWRKVLIFETTTERYFETLNAWEVLNRLYYKERRKIQKAIIYGFLDKHELFYQPTPEEAKKRKRREGKDPDAEARRVGYDLSRHMEDAELMRRLAAGK